MAEKNDMDDDRHDDSPSTGSNAYLAFELNREGYAARILDVDQIIAFDGVRAVPAAPRAVAGIMDIDGSVISVIELGTKLGVGHRESESACVVVVRAHDERVGLVVDDVRDVVDIDTAAITPLPDTTSDAESQRGAWSRGVARVGDDLYLLLDLDAILSTADVTPLRTSDV